MMDAEPFRRALAAFDARAFATKHGGYKETRSEFTFEYLLPCPHCGSSRLRWNHPVKQAWQCWGCYKSGDTVDLVGLLEECDRGAALELIESNYHGGDVDLNLGKVELPSVASSIEVMRWPHGVEALAPTHTRAWSYLATRGVSPDMIMPWRVGFGRTGWLRDYLVFPCWWRGQLAYWQGRIAREVQRGDRRKSRNPTSTGRGWTASSVVMPGDMTVGADHVVLVEGPFDALKVGRNAIALLGKSFNARKLSWIVSLSPRVVTVYLDSDAQDKAIGIARKLANHCEAYVATPPEGCDPGDLTPVQNAVCLQQARRIPAGMLQ